MCHSPSTRLEKDLTSPLIPRGTWNTILVHIHDSFLLPQTTKIFTFTWGAPLLSLHLWGFFKSEPRCAVIWDLCLLHRCSQSPQVHCSIPPLSVLQEQLLQLLLPPGLECSAHKQKQFTTLKSKLLLDPAVQIYVICKIIWVIVIYTAHMHMGRKIYEKCRAKVGKITKQCQRRFKEYCKEYGNILVCDEASPQTVFLSFASSAWAASSEKKNNLILDIISSCRVVVLWGRRVTVQPNSHEHPARPECWTGPGDRYRAARSTYTAR